MIYNYIHQLFQVFIDLETFPSDYIFIVYFFEIWAVLIFFKWSLVPLKALIDWATRLSKGLRSIPSDWRPEWTRKQKRSLKKGADTDKFI